MSCRAGSIWEHGRGMIGGDGLAKGAASTQVWLPRGDPSVLSPRSSLRNSSSLTLEVAAMRKLHQQRLRTPHVTADGYVTSSHWSARSGSSSVSGLGGLGGTMPQESFASWATQASTVHSQAQTEFPAKIVWRANSGSLNGGYGLRTNTLNGSVHSQESRERLEAARAWLASADGPRSTLNSSKHSLHSRDRRQVNPTGADHRPPMRSARPVVHHGALVLHAVPPQEYGTVQHTLRDWKRLVPQPRPPERLTTQAVAPSSSNGDGDQQQLKRLGTPPLAKLRESLASPTASPRPLTDVASAEAPMAGQLPHPHSEPTRCGEQIQQGGEGSSSDVVPPSSRMSQPAAW